MAELPFHLKTLEPLTGALDILRFFGTVDVASMSTDVITSTLGLSERAASKAIRRLVTKNYIQMDPDQTYRLSEKGNEAVEELAEYDEATGGGLELPDEFYIGGDDEEEDALELVLAELPIDLPEGIVPPSQPEKLASPAAPVAKKIARRMVLAVPQPLVANQPFDVLVGFHEAPPDEQLPNTAQLVIRLSVVNGEPEAPEDALFALSNAHAHHAIQVTPGRYKEVRIRLEAYQMGASGGIDEIGGMYVDVPVTESGQSGQWAAFGADVALVV